MKRENNTKKRSPTPVRIFFGKASGLFDQTFWRFFSGFVFVLIVSISLLAVVGVWREAADNYAQLIQLFQK